MGRAFPEYETFDAVGLAALVAEGEVTPEELVAAAAERLDERNPQLNAVIRTDHERARNAAANVDPTGPFAGVPFLVKDLVMVEGETTSFGSVFFREYVPEASSEFSRRMLGSGLISLGRTNTPEFGLLPITEPVLHGATANPWSLDHSPGGSSGGAGAAVAAGIVPIAHGGDGGGSIRIPASNCGTFGLKVSRGRVPQHPPSAADDLSVGGCLSRSVRDSAAFLDVVAGAVPGSKWSLPNPPRRFAEAPRSDPGVLRIAVLTTSFADEPIHADCVAAVESTAALLEELGHTVDHRTARFDADQIADSFLTVWAALAESIFQLILVEAGNRRVGRALRRALGDWRTVRTIARLDERKTGLDAFEPFTWELVKRSRKRTPAQLALAEVELQRIAFDLAALMDGYDAILTPTMGLPPQLTGELDQSAGWDEVEALVRRYVPFTPMANFTGRPAMSVPLHWNGEGLPIGSQFTGNMGDEFTLLSLAGQLERARPWFDRRPPSFA